MAERILVAKVGLDGHDRGIKVVTRLLRDAGFEVIYGGLRQTPETIAAVALQEDVDAVGISIHSGSHLTLAPAVVQALRDRGLDTPVILGGIIPDQDQDALLAAGVASILTPGAGEDEVVAAVRQAVDSVDDAAGRAG
jgi:methylmalonyl-CoA mutase C-terminal domain/subunit